MLCQGPYASGRDWGAIEKALKEEGDEKKEGEAALNEMFQKIYADASDDVKRAMNKSFQESGGTVSHRYWLSSDDIRSFYLGSVHKLERDREGEDGGEAARRHGVEKVGLRRWSPEWSRICKLQYCIIFCVATIM